MDGDEVRATPGRSEMDKSNRIVLHCDMSLGAISAVCLQERNTHKDLADSFILFIFVLTKQTETMEHRIIELKTNINGIPKFAKATIIFEYSKGVYEVEFMVNGESFTFTLTDEDFSFIN